MAKKKYLWTALALLIVASATLAGVIIAQNDDYADIYRLHDGDGDIVAIVNGLEVTRGDLRTMPSVMMRNAPDLSEDEAIRRSIYTQIDHFVIQSEVRRRGMLPSLSETEEFMAPHRESCSGPHGADCRELISALGYEYDEFWKVALPGYQKDLGQIRLMGTLTEAELTELRASPVIEWKDEKLQDLYQEALIEHEKLSASN